jgi:hypothetical protein
VKIERPDIDLQLFADGDPTKDDPDKKDPPKDEPAKKDPAKTDDKKGDDFETWGKKVLDAIADLGKKIPGAQVSQGQQGQGQQAQGSVTVVVPPAGQTDKDKDKPKKGILARLVDRIY